MRSEFFGPAGDITSVLHDLKSRDGYTHFSSDITNETQVSEIFKKIQPDIVIHCAAQPSHDKASEIPIVDFDVNARGTIILLEAFRKYCSSSSTFIHMSTNKVYGDGPNNLDILENDTRWEYRDPLYREIGIPETFSIDNCLHSLVGASKVSADIIAQEYGKYFDLNVGIFRGGCLTGPQHAGVELHGFLSYIIKCAARKNHYTIFGYKGKQVRDQIHCDDVAALFEKFIENPRKGEVYNLGGGYKNSASVLEIIETLSERYDLNLSHTIEKENRIGDHICYYSDLRKIKNHFPTWKLSRDLDSIIDEMVHSERNNK